MNYIKRFDQLKEKMLEFGFEMDDVWDDNTQIRFEGTPKEWAGFFRQELLSLISEIREEMTSPLWSENETTQKLATLVEAILNHKERKLLGALEEPESQR